MDAQEGCAGKGGVERVPVLTLMRSEGRESCLDTWGGGEVYTRLAGSSGQDLLPSVLPLFLFCAQDQRAQPDTVPPPFVLGIRSSE